MSRRPRLTIGRVIIGIAGLAAWLGVARFHPGAAIFTLFVGLQVVTFLVAKPTQRPKERKASPRANRRFRFAIWQIMALVAVLTILVRAQAFFLFSRNPLWGYFEVFWRAATGSILLLGLLAGVALLA